MSNKEVVEDFIKTYYRKNPIPNEILIEKELDNKEDLEKFFEKKYNSKTKILNPKKGKNFKLIKLAKKNLEIEFDFSIEKNLKEKLNLKFLPKIIECYDMSNLGHKDLVGAMTRFIKQNKDKKNFRKYNIKSFKGKNDDYFSFREVIFRRFYKNSNLTKERLKQITKDLELDFSFSKSEKIELPNLVIVDGGVGQLNTTLEVLKLLKLENKFDLISLAKKEETIYKYDNDELHQYKLDIKTNEMKHIIRVRDSTHKFVISFNRSKRKIK